jgi:hypothetical protein
MHETTQQEGVKSDVVKSSQQLVSHVQQVQLAAGAPEVAAQLAEALLQACGMSKG